MSKCVTLKKSVSKRPFFMQENEKNEKKASLKGWVALGARSRQGVGKGRVPRQSNAACNASAHVGRLGSVCDIGRPTINRSEKNRRRLDGQEG